jgi:hypothetical protein
MDMARSQVRQIGGVVSLGPPAPPSPVHTIHILAAVAEHSY